MHSSGTSRRREYGERPAAGSLALDVRRPHDRAPLLDFGFLKRTDPSDANATRGTGDIFDDDGLTKLGPHPLGEDACNGVRSAPSLLRDLDIRIADNLGVF